MTRLELAQAFLEVVCDMERRNIGWHRLFVSCADTNGLWIQRRGYGEGRQIVVYNDRKDWEQNRQPLLVSEPVAEAAA